MRKWTNISLAAFHVLFYNYELADEIIQPNCNTNLIITMLKLNAKMTEFNLNIAFTFIEADSFLRKIKKYTNLVKFEEIEDNWDSVVITEKIRKIYLEYINRYEQLIGVHNRLAFNLFIYDIYAEVFRKNGIQSILLKLNDYETIIMETSITKHSFRFICYDYKVVYSSLTPLGKRFLLKTLLENCNIEIKWANK